MTQDKGCPQATNALVQPQAPEAQSEDSEAGSLPRAMRAAMPLTGSSGQELPLHIRTRSHSWQPAVQGNGGRGLHAVVDAGCIPPAPAIQRALLVSWFQASGPGVPSVVLIPDAGAAICTPHTTASCCIKAPVNSVPAT
eukprot:CAMPEP_0174291692 /NCGR_PEP_ID=MMETSP0809-20121228/32919_1 /TAXON_ID=73025 ORGANISM="Eutreptiella gymnastica-like, Strain CCMP1594" /NCGR_SAMPLE_ID=MMETSP0809 /ASSEMBLY_ACC=CAM_ASM_000658 /LENGTH=138 /DNA_ID=CAMNT_0015391199 /DNA_START=423 /DNA_END=838 /DNA_ORIENTATION=+